MKKLWSWNKQPIGFEGGPVPTSRGKYIFFLWPVISYIPYSMDYLYGNMITINFLKWYIAIKWKYQPSTEDND